MAPFTGTELPGWMAGALEAGLASVVLFGHNTPDPQTAAGLAREIHARAEHCVVAIDEEGGDVTRLQAATGSSLPTAWALGAADDIELTRDVGKALGDLLAACDLDLDLAPVLDVCTDPANPVIGTRAFGDDPDRVANHAKAFATGLMEAGLGTCAKHFPGHGATATDSHTALPLIDLGEREFAREHLAPWRIAPWLDSVMTAHVLVPAQGEGPASISTWSRPLLDRAVGGTYQGLVITDALDMAAVTADPGYGESAVRAIEAGADLLCLGTSLRRDDQQMLREVHDALLDAVDSGRIPRQRLRDRAARTRDRLRSLRTRRRFVPAPRSRTPWTAPSSSVRRPLRGRSVPATRGSSPAPPASSTCVYGPSTPPEPVPSSWSTPCASAACRPWSPSTPTRSMRHPSCSPSPACPAPTRRRGSASRSCSGAGPTRSWSTPACPAPRPIIAAWCSPMAQAAP
ncbi:glycoside hydrolase family 3 N-terminal domain-containing protein [Brachybacterium avium]|uniref:glycoside hydrolase family 3 N-terminal domain-containing protein n=1 Tax=Brachybacterium avium TaxID=2017485 RepID=UPI001FEA4062|nr:glycoside hydrolase family 3 N-terminal domain-containing protein [Brachybacterium avium]